MTIKTIEAKKGRTLVTKDKSCILGKVLVCRSDYEDYTEVEDDQLEEIKKAIAEEAQKKLQAGE